LDISFKNRKLEDEFNSEVNLIKAYNVPRAKKIMTRMELFIAADHLGMVPAIKPENCHPLKGKRKGQFAVDLDQPYRLIFEPDHDPVPLKEDGGVDLEKVSAIKILEVIDYHQ
jgi:proteic killer suppression protein